MEGVPLTRSHTGFLRLSSHLLRLLLALLFLWAGVSKLLDPKTFARSIDAFGLVPEPMLVVTALGLPVLEIFIAVAVALRWRCGLPLMGAMLLLFIGVLWYGVLQGLEVDCGCFSLAEQGTHTSLRQAFWRDWLMLAAALYVYLTDRPGRSAFKRQPSRHFIQQGE